MQRLGLGKSVPATLVLDRDGQPVARLLDVVIEDYLRHLLDDLLKNGGRRAQTAEVVVVDATVDHSGHDHAAGEHDGSDHVHEGSEATSAEATGADAERGSKRKRRSEASLVPS